jgi:hypothetical protein
MSEDHKAIKPAGWARRSFLARLLGGIGAAGVIGALVPRILVRPGHHAPPQHAPERRDVAVTIHPLAVPRSTKDHPVYGD